MGMLQLHFTFTNPSEKVLILLISVAKNLQSGPQCSKLGHELMPKSIIMTLFEEACFMSRDSWSRDGKSRVTAPEDVESRGGVVP